MLDETQQTPTPPRGPWATLVGIGLWVTSFPGLLAALLVAKLFWACRDRIVDPDLWWHLKNAQYLMTTGHFPSMDHYSFFYYWAYQAFGPLN